MDELISGNLSRPVFRRRPYPYIIVRLMAAVMQRERVVARVGPPEAYAGYRRSYVQHPAPLGDGLLCAEPRWLLIKATREAVQRTRFNMCVVWGPESATFCWRGGTVTHSSEPPRGGVGGADGGVSMTEALAVVAAKVESKAVTIAQAQDGAQGVGPEVACACTAGGSEGERCRVVHVAL